MATILVIEDEAILREETVEWLTFEGHDAVGAADGEAGVAYTTFYEPDLIICDIMMPKMNGYGVLLAIQSNPNTVGIPFIFLTARISHEDIRKGMELGADDYITKPFTRLELLKAVDARLNRRDQQLQQHEHELQLMQDALVQLHNRHLLQAKLLQMLSHDFNGPLTSILLTSNILHAHDDKFDKETRLQHLDQIGVSARLLQQMLEDIVLINQLEQGRLTLRPVEVIPSTFLERILQVFKALYSNKCEIHMDVRNDEHIMVDVRMLRQITMNLVNNAFKFSETNGILRVTLYREGDEAILCVADNGIGIAKEDQDSLFEAFQRGSNVSEIAGTGLGLAIVKQAVDLHGGTVTLQSKLGEGTTITVTLPLLE